MAVNVLTKGTEPNIFMNLYKKYNSEIMIGIGCILFGLFIWFCVWLLQKLRPGESYGPYASNGWGGVLNVIGNPTDVTYQAPNGISYTVKHPADSVIYQDLKGTMPQFIMPGGGPQLLHASETYKYITMSDISVSQLSANILQQFVMPTGSQIELETRGDLAIFCTWTGGGQTLKFIVGNHI